MCFEYISYEIMTDVQTIYIVIFAIKILFDGNQISILLWRMFFLFSVVVVVCVRISVVEVVTSVSSVSSMIRVSVGVVIKCSISLRITLGNNMFGGHARYIWVVAVSVWVGVSVWVASVSSCWVSSINMWVYSVMSICRVKKSGIRVGFALGNNMGCCNLGNNMGNGVLVIVVRDYSMVVVDGVVDSMVVDSMVVDGVR